MMTGNVTITEVVAPMYVVLSKAETTCLTGNQLVPQNVRLYSRGRYNRGQLYYLCKSTAATPSKECPLLHHSNTVSL